jgi:hypothetical protein
MQGYFRDALWTWSLCTRWTHSLHIICECLPTKLYFILCFFFFFFFGQGLLHARQVHFPSVTFSASPMYLKSFLD